MIFWESEQSPWLTPERQQCLERLVLLALQKHGQEPERVDLSFWLVGRETMRAYHQRFRGQARDTDVLAFSDGTQDPDTGRVYLGDVLVCVPVAEEQARRLGHRLEEELCLLVLHGVLHLLGYDDETPETRREMWAMQARILQEAGCGPLTLMAAEI